jgi:hypothetical protein
MKLMVSNVLVDKIWWWIVDLKLHDVEGHIVWHS